MSASTAKLRVSPALHSYLRRAVFDSHPDGHILNTAKRTFSSYKSTRFSQSLCRNSNTLCDSLAPTKRQYQNHPTISNISSRDCALSSSSATTKSSSFATGNRRYYAEPVAETRRGFFRRLPPEAVERKKNASSASSRYLDPLSEKSILGRSFTLQNHGDVMLRCTEFDSEGREIFPCPSIWYAQYFCVDNANSLQGKVKATSRDFKKMELCTQVSSWSRLYKL